jgi:hypothetical protein
MPQRDILSSRAISNSPEIGTGTGPKKENWSMQSENVSVQVGKYGLVRFLSIDLSQLSCSLKKVSVSRVTLGGQPFISLPRGVEKKIYYVWKTEQPVD